MSISISGDGTFTGVSTNYSFDKSVSVGGTVTYEDVTNVDSIGIVTARSGLHVVGAASSVGIGTDDPAYLLDLSNSSNAYLRQVRGNSTLRVGPAGDQASDGAVLGTDTDGPLRFFTNGSSNERMRIDSSGNVGLGTISPARQFTIYNSITPIIQLVNSTTGDTLNDGLMLYESGTNFVIENQENGEIRFHTNGAKRATIDSSGRLIVTNSLRANYTHFSSTFQSGSTVWDTGYSINQSNGGGCSLLLASRNTSNGTSTQAAVYRIHWYYDGNNAPATSLLSGTDFITFSTTGSNTLGISGNTANWVVSLIHSSNIQF